MAHPKVSLPVINRLPRYYRYLNSLRLAGTATISSSELASLMGTTASQVRQDFNCFGGFGQQGIGYTVEVLCAELEKLLVGDNQLTTILVGTGRLGRAISHFLAHEANGYTLLAAFDQNPAEIGQQLEGVDILDVNNLADYCQQHHPDVAVLCLPEKGASVVAPILISRGVTGFWNFSHFDLAAQYPDLVVENVHLSDSLMSLGYRVRHNTEKEDET